MEITNYDDVIDSRDVIERIEELENELSGDYVLDGAYSLEDIEEFKKELETLQRLAEEAEQYSADWGYGSTLIRYDYFEEYMDDMIDECYDIPRNLPSFMIITLDYEALRMDYSEIEFNGVTYYIR